MSQPHSQEPSQLLHPVWSYTLVASQFFWIAVLAWQMGLPKEPIAIALHFLGAVLGLWAIKTMHLGHFNIIPDPLPHLNLVTTGPYRWIRHPMYASILVFFLPAILFYDHWSIWLSYLALWVTLILKLLYEERLLTQKCADYADYQTHTARLIPGFF